MFALSVAFEDAAMMALSANTTSITPTQSQADSHTPTGSYRRRLNITKDVSNLIVRSAADQIWPDRIPNFENDIKLIAEHMRSGGSTINWTEIGNIVGINRSSCKKHFTEVIMVNQESRDLSKIDKDALVEFFLEQVRSGIYPGTECLKLFLPPSGTHYNFKTIRKVFYNLRHHKKVALALQMMGTSLEALRSQRSAARSV